jgi:tRNA U34 2-thiouridine synthase MnmA/TrmU
MDRPFAKVRALGLCSGGLDSILSALVLRRQGIEVAWITFETPFFSADKARRAARLNDIPITVRNITPTYLEMLKNPPAGYGKHMNPCMDCHALMFRLAGEAMVAEGFDFLFSGEVSGQRPMSQNKASLRYVEKRSGFDGHIVRPLSARQLPVTPAEEQGLVDRERLLDFSGRSRKPQMALARELGVTDYPSPAGGCLLTDKGYSTRLRDLMDHGIPLTEPALYLLKHGRHIRLTPETKLIVGRTRPDNETIEGYVNPDTDLQFKVQGFPGPLALIPGGCNDRDVVARAAAVVAGYSKAPAGTEAKVTLLLEGNQETVRVIPTPPIQNRNLLI